MQCAYLVAPCNFKIKQSSSLVAAPSPIYNPTMTINLEATLNQIPVVVLDTETTGLRAGLGHRVVELGAVRFENWQAVDEISEMINPGRMMDPGASNVNGIYDGDLVGKPGFEAIADRLEALIDGALMVAHNAPFDAEYVSLEMRLIGRTIPENPWLDTLLLARRHFYFGRNNLSHIAAKLGVRIGRAHRALNDVHMTAEVLKRMARELDKQGMHTVGDLLHAQGEPVYCPPPPKIFLPELLAEALANKQDLDILYIGNDGESNRRITPLYATQYRGDDYLIAYCQLKKDQRTFKVERILGAELVTP